MRVRGSGRSDGAARLQTGRGRKARPKIKKKLDLDHVEAETVQLIFKLYLYGDGDSGALGVKQVIKWLNRNGYRTRRGETFGVASVHKILTNTVYIGQWKFNQTSSRTRQRKPDEEVVTIPVPGLIDPQVFEQFNASFMPAVRGWLRRGLRLDQFC